MTVEYTYRCSLCRATLSDREPGEQYPGGWALTRTDQGKSLEPGQLWRDSPIHLCQTCVTAVGDFRNVAQSDGERRAMNAREHGEQLADFVRDHIEGTFDGHIPRLVMAAQVVCVLEEMGLYEPPKAQATPKPKPMSDAQARAFGDTQMPFGKHDMHKIRDVPLDYLCRLVDPSEFLAELRRYLDNEQIKREIEKP